MKVFSYLAPLVIALLTGAIYQPNPVPASRHRFIVIAHRGDHVIYPENTLEAYREAINNKADYIEIDLRTTKDGKLISMHDATVNRMTNGTGLVKDLFYEQIAALTIKSRTSADTVMYKIPTFEQILKLSKNKIYIYIDFKEADATATLAMLKQLGMEKQVLIYINKPSQFTDWRKTAQDMPLMVSLPDSVKTADALSRFASQYHPDILDGNYGHYTPAMLDAAKKINLPVWPDAQSATEGPLVWDQAIATGFRGLQTDHPAALIKYLEQKGLR